jgi:hypothetical protein
MKSLSFIITPTIILIVGCVFLNASWPYYIIAIATGNGFGVLALFTWFQLRDNSGRPYIKFHSQKKNKEDEKRKGFGGTKN